MSFWVKSFNIVFLNFLLCGWAQNLANAQSVSYTKNKIDSTYISDYHNELITRAFGSRKYTSYALQDKGYAERLRYLPNSPFNVGVGFNYKMIGINLGFNLPIINDTKIYGKTNFLDLQSHIYGRKLIVDFYLQRYKGFYLPNSQLLQNNNDNLIYLRPDLMILNSGVECQYLFNWRKFTFRGAFLQNEVQQKSAGSPIVGIYVGNISVQGDSALVPTNIKYLDFFNRFSFYHSNIRSATLSFGYGYTVVFPHHFFITAAASGGLGINNTLLRSSSLGSISNFGSNVSGTMRIGLGYNARRYFAGIHYVATRSSNNSPIQYARQELGAGNFRISLAHRFTIKKKLFGFY